MRSYQISLTPPERAAGRLIAMVRRALQRALAEEQQKRGLTQAAIADALDVNRSVIHRQIMGMEDISLGRVGAIACILGREPTFYLGSETQHYGVNAETRATNQITEVLSPSPRPAVVDTVVDTNNFMNAEWPSIPRTPV